MAGGDWGVGIAKTEIRVDPLDQQTLHGRHPATSTLLLTGLNRIAPLQPLTVELDSSSRLEPLILKPNPSKQPTRYSHAKTRSVSLTTMPQNN